MYCCNVKTMLIPLFCGWEFQLCWLKNKGSHCQPFTPQYTQIPRLTYTAYYIASLTKKTSLNCLRVVLTCNVE